MRTNDSEALTLIKKPSYFNVIAMALRFFLKNDDLKDEAIPFGNVTKVLSFNKGSA